MKSAWRINAYVVAFAVGYLFVGVCVDRACAVLAPSGLKVALGCGGALLLAFALGRENDVAKRSGDRGATRPAEVCACRGGRDGTGFCNCLSMDMKRRDVASRQKGSVPEWRRYLRLFERAFRQGSVVESAYWLAIAQLRGAKDCTSLMDECVEIWLGEGCPGEEDRVHAGFSAEQSSFGRAVLRYYSMTDVSLAITRLMELEAAGNGDAKAFLDANVRTSAEAWRS